MNAKAFYQLCAEARKYKQCFQELPEVIGKSIISMISQTSTVRYTYIEPIACAGESFVLRYKRDKNDAIVKIQHEEIATEKSSISWNDMVRRRYRHDIEKYDDRYRFLRGAQVEDLVNKWLREEKNPPPAIVPAIYGWNDFPTWVEIEYFDGYRFLEWAQEKNVETIAHKMIELLDTLYCVHNFGIVHRDIKPSNILITKNNEKCVIVDWTHSKPLHKRAFVEVTRNNQGLATMLYGSTVALGDAKNILPRDDVVSSGIMLYVLVRGFEPFLSKNDIELAIKDPVKYRLAMRENFKIDSFNEILREPFRRATYEDADDRFETAKEFADSLRVAIDVQKLPSLNFKTKRNRLQKPEIILNREAIDSAIDVNCRYSEAVRKLMYAIFLEDYE